MYAKSPALFVLASRVDTGQIPRRTRTIRGLQSVPLRAVRRIDVRRRGIRHRVRVECLDGVQDGGIGQGEQGGKVGSELGGGVVVSRYPNASLVCVEALRLGVCVSVDPIASEGFVILQSRPEPC
jgi:hypothetical protein